MGVTVVRLRKDAEERSLSGEADLLPLYEKALALLLEFAAKADARYVHIELEQAQMLQVWRLEDGQDIVLDFPTEMPGDLFWELLGLAESDFKGIGEHFEATAAQVGSSHSPVLLVEGVNGKSYWDRTWTDSLVQFRRVV